MNMKWLTLLAMVAGKIPIERLVFKPPSNKERLEKLRTILADTHTKPAESPIVENPENLPEHEMEAPLANLGNQRQKIHLESNPDATSIVTTKETVDYQNREIGKSLLTMQRHCVQKFRIAGKVCDCGQTRHLLEMEALAEEAMAMVENPEIYYRILNWIRRLGPICTIEAVSTGKYDDQYPAFGNEARDLRKELLGTLDSKALFPEKHVAELTERPSTEEEPRITEEEFENQRKELLTRGIIT